MENDLGRIMLGERIRSSVALLSELQRGCVDLIVFETRTIASSQLYVISVAARKGMRVSYLQLTSSLL